MAERGAGHGVSWFVIGFLSGVAATLAVLIFGTVRSGRTVERATAPSSTVITYTPPKTEHLRSHAEAPPAESSSPYALTAPAGGPDQQVQEDAAAAGMTSRRVQPAADIH
jgi:hypothetical protein